MQRTLAETELVRTICPNHRFDAQRLGYGIPRLSTGLFAAAVGLRHFDPIYECLFAFLWYPPRWPKSCKFSYKRDKELVHFWRDAFLDLWGVAAIGFAKPNPKTTKPSPKTTKPNLKTSKPNPAARSAAPPVTIRAICTNQVLQNSHTDFMLLLMVSTPTHHSLQT